MKSLTAAMRICLCILIGLSGTLPLSGGPASTAYATPSWPVTATMGNENGGTVFKINGTPVVPQFLYGSTMKIHSNYGPFLDTIPMANNRDVHVKFCNNTNYFRDVLFIPE